MNDEEQYEPIEHVVSILEKVAADYRTLRAENERLREELAEYIGQAERGHQTMVADACEFRKEIHKLRAALKPFAELGMRQAPGSDGDTFIVNIPKASDIRAAAAALKETDNG